jgi:hypothetical protein
VIANDPADVPRPTVMPSRDLRVKRRDPTLDERDAVHRLAGALIDAERANPADESRTASRNARGDSAREIAKGMVLLRAIPELVFSVQPRTSYNALLDILPQVCATLDGPEMWINRDLVNEARRLAVILTGHREPDAARGVDPKIAADMVEEARRRLAEAEGDVEYTRIRISDMKRAEGKTA